ncbi:MAG: hypothetical protein GIW99_05410 [Candidatus Eremiobacteraeota bacterium]|nr:hypothetical protein [Candidatus Eremiobacteraeota bacterium]
MQFTDLPLKAPREWYDEAMDLYRGKVASRIKALYRVGNITYPGLSDLDLLLVTSESRLDNNQFFSFERLPHRLHRLFLHQPFIIPADMTSIIEYTTHSRRELLYGDDIFDGSTSLENFTINYCRSLESFCHYRTYVARTRQRGWVSARMMIAVASAFRFSLADFALGETGISPQRYGERIDALRAAYYEEVSTPQALLQEAWSTLSGTVDDLERQLKERLPLRPGESSAEFAETFVNGQREVECLDESLVLRRRAIIEKYHRRLAQLRLSYGFLFYLTAYSRTLQPYRQRPLVRRIAQARYKPQRLIDEFKHRLPRTPAR